MKTIIFLLLISITAAAQDTSKQIIRIQFMQKHIAYMGAYLSVRNTIQDSRTRDTLSARIGSATRPDSVTTGGYQAGYVLRFFEQIMDEQTGTGYDFFRELVNGKSGYTGVLSQLNTLVGQSSAAAIWLRRQLIELMARKEAVMSEKLTNGASWLKTPIE